MAKVIKVVEETRRAPSKKCVKCGVSIHARTVMCKECGATQPIKVKKLTGAPKQEEPKTVTEEMRKVKADAIQTLRAEKNMLRIVVKLGGMEETQALLTELINTFGNVKLDTIYGQLADWEIANK